MNQRRDADLFATLSLGYAPCRRGVVDVLEGDTSAHATSATFAPKPAFIGTRTRLAVSRSTM